MPPHDVHSEEGLHPDVAGWVLGALDHDDAMSFVAHLHECDQCSAAVAELRPAAWAIPKAAPALEPPADLGARTLSAVRQAATAERRAATEPGRQVEAKSTKWWRWHWNTPLVSAASALAGAAVVFVLAVVVPLLHASPAGAVSIPLHSPTAHGKAYGLATARQVARGTFHVNVSVHGLADLGPRRVYDCWYTKPGTNKWVLAGSFSIGSSGSGAFPMTSAANPRDFPTMRIIAETLGNPNPTGTTVLTGRAQL